MVTTLTDPAFDDAAPDRFGGISTPYFDGVVQPAHVELRITRDELTDSDNVEEFGHLLGQVCDDHGVQWVLIDVAQLQYVTSSILSRFITLNRRLVRDGGGVVLVNPSEMFDDVLRATNLSDYFRVTPTLDAARDALP